MRDSLVEELPVPQRLALTYSPAEMRGMTLALLALDTRCGTIIRQAREPILAQMRLAWWRELLQKPCDEWPTGDPLIELLGAWAGEAPALVNLVESWETLLSDFPLKHEHMDSFASGRGTAFAALARLAGEEEYVESVRQAGHCWGLVDLAQGLSNPEERAMAFALAEREAISRWNLPRKLRTLAVLGGLARRSMAKGGRPLLSGPGDMVVALRLGMIGR
ncbi:hypothetical protein MB02_03165 [Croceicoccus estronivorus]|uniref:hypothetical protein n=1 Tax=Croceicoccus estronivorus TaxID=1172626 RepID=UPI000836A462|nr:hypothetical protein [Croceicoccus estronivorus]OCC24505.1 hypothetical protein MB02_03165 [Croceicoccus estronivorus]